MLLGGLRRRLGVVAGAARQQLFVAQRPASSGGGETMRVSRLLAQRGAMSRRQADVAIAQGRVTVGGAVVFQGEKAAIDATEVRVDGRRVDATGPSGAPPKVWLAYKKRGEVVAREAAGGPPSVFSRLGLGRHACAVGRLDVNSEGLLVLTSCGMLARAMEHPDLGGLRRVYEVTVHGYVTPSKIAAMRRGVAVGGVKYKPLRVAISDAREKRALLTITCAEGKNRMIRRIMDHLKLRVSRLKRVKYGPFRVGSLPDQNTVLSVPLPKGLKALVDGPPETPTRRPPPA